jgi:outer membrane protein assembly factor BamA
MSLVPTNQRARLAALAALLWCGLGWAGLAQAQVMPEDPADVVPDVVGEGGEADIEVKAKRLRADLEGQPVVHIEFECDLALCDDPVVVEKFRDLAGLYVGMRLSEQALRRAEQRLAKTGFFEAIEWTTLARGSGVELQLDARGAVLIRRVEFDGVSGPPFESDLRKLLIYRQGQAYRTDQAKVDAQLKTLRDEFEEEGFFGTEIELTVRPVSGQSHLVDLRFDIDKGEELEICHIGLRGLRSLTYDEARAELLSGHSIWTRTLGIRAPRFSTNLFKQGQEALIDHYRDQGFFQARIVDRHVTRDADAGCVTILVDLSEGPRWKVDFSGDLHFSEQELRSELPFYESGYVDDEELLRAERAIRKLYETRGYPLAEVRATEERHDHLDRGIEFAIEAGPRLQIEGIRIHGNEHLSKAELTKDFGTRTFGLFADGGYLQSEQLLADLLQIEEAYRSAGFLQATVERYEVQLLPNREELRVHIYVDEGERVFADRVSFSGNRTVTRGLLADEVTVRTDGPLAPLELRADRSRLMQLYSSYGYPLAEVETSCRSMTGEELACQAPRMPAGCVASTLEELDQLCHWSDERDGRRICRRIRRERGCQLEGGISGERVRVAHQITEGPFVRVGEVLLKGNFKTNTELIYEELPLSSGDAFDVSKVLEGQGNMRSLGVFDSVSIEAIGLDDQARTENDTSAALLISVEESRSRYLDFKVGLEGRDLLGDGTRLLVTGETQYNDDNLFGRAQRFRPRLIGAFDAMQLFAAGTEQAGISQNQPDERLDYLVGAELIYNHPRFLKGLTDVDKLLLTVAPFYMLDLVGVTQQDVLREEWGLRLEVRKQLDEILDRLFVSVGIEGKQAALWTPADPTVDGQRIFSPRRVTGKLVPEVTLDRRDSPLNPKEGYYLQVQPGLVSGATLVQGGEHAIEDAYLRLVATASVYLELLDDLVLGQGVRYGHVVPFFGRDRLVTEDERFRLGGAGSVRGFGNNTLGPLEGEQPTGGEFVLNYNAELRYPLIRGINLYGAVFFDAGLLADCFGGEQNSDIRIGCYEDAFGPGDPLERFRSAAGLGIRYLIADQIPLVVDYGMVLDRRAGERFGNIHFNLGYTF